MGSSSTVRARYSPVPQTCRHRGVFLALALAAALLGGCSHQPRSVLSVDELPPLLVDGRSVVQTDMTEREPAHDLLALDDSMRAFVARYTDNLDDKYQRMLSLHRAVRGAGSLDIQYDPFADGSAMEAFHRGTANCLSYANLFVALAREAGLDARYQWLEVRPRWSRVSERVQVQLHVNVTVQLRDGRRFMVDIDPLPSQDVADSREISDADAEALYYNNIAMSALAEGNPTQAWLYLVRALRLSSPMAHLWVNLGAVYRSSGQHRAAEQSYLQALELDPREYSAMVNLAVLYGLEGRRQEQEYWLGQVEYYRQSNPYFHAWEGDEAAKENDWIAALRHYDRAVELAPQDSRLLFARGIIHYQLAEFEEAAADIASAIEQATLHSDIENYQQQLEQVRRAQLVSF